MRFRLLCIISLFLLILASCDNKWEDVGNGEVAKPIIYTYDTTIQIRYYIEGKSFEEKYPFKELCKNTSNVETLPIFFQIDSAIVFNQDKDSVKCIKGDNDTRNILLEKNYTKSIIWNPSKTTIVEYAIENSYFSDSNYVNPLIQY
ncbi:MAG: hypothetical protein MJ069_09020 [Salinivirgaceae bacterium]|nr:hypothetical protein [Salinivirgaceae bacterium]